MVSDGTCPHGLGVGRSSLEGVVWAGLHFFGGAFEPEHMRSLANIAADALDLRWDADGGRLHRDLPDYEAAMAGAMERAREMAAALGFELITDEDLDGR